MIVYEKSFRLGGIGNIKRRERNIEFESCFFLFISRRAFAEEMEKIFLRANFSSDTKFRRRVYLFFSLSLYFEGEGKKCFQERFSIPQTSPRFSNFLPLVFPSISTSPLLSSLILFPFFPCSNIGPCIGQLVPFTTRYTRGNGRRTELHRKTRETEAIRFESARFLVNRR